jgi:hypothetical protein
MKKALRTACVVVATLAAAAVPVHAELIDALQVDTDDTGEPAKASLDLHVNTTPRGRTDPEYPSEVVPNRGWRVTPELNVGVADRVEVGVALPVDRDAAGHTALAGVKAHVKWIPLRPPDGESGMFLGGQFELSHLKQCFEESPTGAELKFIGGWHNEDWLVAVNPRLSWNLSGELRSKTADVGLDAKVSRNVAKDLALGLELYSKLGTTRHLLPGGLQTDSLFAVLDTSVHGWDVDLGIGRGLTASADKLTVKLNLSIPF